MTSHSNKLLKAKEVAAWLNVSESAVWKWTDEGSFPKPIRFGEHKKGHATRWVENDIQEWLENKRESSD